MQRKFTILLAVVAVVLIGAACSRLSPATPAPPAEPVTLTPAPAISDNQTTPTPVATPKTTTTPVVKPVAGKTVTVTMNNGGFSPSEITIAKGDTVRFENKGAKSMWPASAPHPTHTNYPAFDPKRGIGPGESWSFIFTKVGSWAYHDHLNQFLYGKIIVK